MIGYQTNSSLGLFRSCPRAYELKYVVGIESDSADRETLAVGSCWHAALEARGRALMEHGDDGRALVAGADVIRATAPTKLWGEKLVRLLCGYVWFWAAEPLEFVSLEEEFAVETHRLAGKMDGKIRLADGRLVLVEYKTSGEDIEPTAKYWDRLKLSTQVGIYGLCGFSEDLPASTLYDVTRKPTIIPKGITKADQTRISSELARTGRATYCGEEFDAAEIDASAFLGWRETERMYGARLAQDIVERPGFYFARREVPRTFGDYEQLAEDVEATMDLVETCETRSSFPRNPDACDRFGVCEFFGLCSAGMHPRADDVSVPSGFRKREKLHSELTAIE